MRALALAAVLFPLAAPALPQNQLYWPSSNTGVSVCAYVDHAGKDWNGGGNRYSGHRGTDIALGVGNDALAAAAGTVVARVDGCPYGYLGSTCGGGFGNHVALFHGSDTTYYAHLASGSGVAAQGAAAACGARLGGTGSSGSSTGPHLHFEVRVGSSAGSPYSGAADDPFSGPVGGPISYWVDQGTGYSSSCGVGAPSPAPAVACDNQPPRGALDAAGCSGVSGWAFDPNAGAQAIGVQLFFGGAAGTGAPSFPVQAGFHRHDLCGPLGSCEHGFWFAAPRSLFDGQPHPVFAYAIDSTGGADAELQGSGLSLTCADLPAAGVRRHVVSPAAFTAWGFSDFLDVQPLTNAQLSGYPQAEDFPAAPEFLRADGTLAVFAIDRGLKRHVPSMDAARAWRLDPATAQVVAPEVLGAYQEGPPLRSRPWLARGAAAAVFVIDDPLPPPSVRVRGGPKVAEPTPRAGAGTPPALRPVAAVPAPPLGLAPGQAGAPPVAGEHDPVQGGCAAAPGLPLVSLVLLALARRRRPLRG